MCDVCHGKAYDILLIPANSHLYCNSRHNTLRCRNLLWLLVVYRTVSGLEFVCLSNVVIEITVLVVCDVI